MTVSASRIGELTARYGNEFPVVIVSAQSDLQHAEATVAAYLCCGKRLSKAALILPASSNHELSYAMCWVSTAVGVLRSKSLVVVVVAIENDVRAGGV